MPSQTRMFFRVLADDLKELAGEAIEFIGAALGVTLLLALGCGVLYLLGWGVAALVNGGPTVADDRVIAAVPLLFGTLLLGLAYACIRDLWRWLRRLWYDAGQRTLERP